MRLRRELQLTVGALVALQLTTSALALSALSGVGPAVEGALRDNVRSTEAVEELLALVALEPARPLSPRFFEALARAEESATEEGERPLLSRVALLRARVGDGAGAPPLMSDALSDAERAALVEDLRALGALNREAMRAADARARRLGVAGAWAMSLLGTLSFGLALLVFRRLRERLELPVAALARVAGALRRGALDVRLTLRDAPLELLAVGRDLNAALDALEAGAEQAEQAEQAARAEQLELPLSTPHDDEARAALLALLDAREEREGACAVLSASGALVAMSRGALDAPAPPHPPAAGSPDRWARAPLGARGLTLATLRPEPAPTIDSSSTPRQEHHG